MFLRLIPAWPHRPARPTFLPSATPRSPWASQTRGISHPCPCSKGSRQALVGPGCNPARIRLHTLGRIREALVASDNPDKTVLWAVACTAFFGFFRLGELLPESATAFNLAMHLAWGDIAVDDRTAPRMVQIHLKRSKCDQFGAGSDIVVGVTGKALCPVTAIVTYIEARGTNPGPFFLDSSSLLINMQDTVSVLERQPQQPWWVLKTVRFRHQRNAWQPCR